MCRSQATLTVTFNLLFEVTEKVDSKDVRLVQPISIASLHCIDGLLSSGKLHEEIPERHGHRGNMVPHKYLMERTVKSRILCVSAMITMVSHSIPPIYIALDHTWAMKVRNEQWHFILCTTIVAAIHALAHYSPVAEGFIPCGRELPQCFIYC